MLGFLLSFGTAIARASTDIGFKIASRRITHDDILLLVQRSVETCLVLGIVIVLPLITTRYAPAITDIFTVHFGLLVVTSVVLNGLALYFSIKALRISDVSVVSPMSQLTPAILLVTSPLMLGESVSVVGGVGVMLVVAGSYFIGISKFKNEKFAIFMPIRALAEDRGVRFALAASFLYGITSNIDKMGIQATDPFVWLGATGVVLCIVVAFIIAMTERHRLRLNVCQLSIGIVPGFTSAAGSILQMFAISIWPVPYVIAVKRLSSLISIVSGRLIFKEEGLWWRSVGALIMVAGTALILLFG